MAFSLNVGTIICDVSFVHFRLSYACAPSWIMYKNTAIINIIQNDGLLLVHFFPTYLKLEYYFDYF